AAVRGIDKELFLYEVALGLTFHATPLHAQTMFAQLFALAEARADLLAVRDRSTSVKLPAGYLGRGPRISNARERQDPDEQRRNFERDAEAIRSGAHLGWL